MKHFPRELSTYRTNSHCGVTNTIKPIERGGWQALLKKNIFLKLQKKCYFLKNVRGSYCFANLSVEKYQGKTFWMKKRGGEWKEKKYHVYIVGIFSHIVRYIRIHT